MNRICQVVLVAVLLGPVVLVLPSPASAQAGTGAFELYAGYYFPDNDVLDNDLTYGIRGTYHWTDAVASELSVGRYEQSFDFLGVAGIDYELILVDLSTAWTFNPGSKAEFAIFAGPGWAFADASAHAFGVSVASVSDDSFTAHVGADLQIALSDRVYLRPDVRARWFEQGGDIDYEASIGLGIRFGI